MMLIFSAFATDYQIYIFLYYTDNTHTYQLSCTKLKKIYNFFNTDAKKTPKTQKNTNNFFLSD